MLLVAYLAFTKWCKKTETLAYGYQMGTHLRVLGESFLMNTNMTGFRWSFKDLCFRVLWMKVASALEGLSHLFWSAKKKPEQFWWYLIAQLIFLISFVGGMSPSNILWINAYVHSYFQKNNINAYFHSYFQKNNINAYFCSYFQKNYINAYICSYFQNIYKYILNVIHTCAIFVKGIPRHDGNPQAWIGLNRTKTPSEWILSWVIRIALCEVWNNTDHSWHWLALDLAANCIWYVYSIQTLFLLFEQFLRSQLQQSKV